MSYKGFFPSGGPSIMRVMADHYVVREGCVWIVKCLRIHPTCAPMTLWYGCACVNAIGTNHTSPYLIHVPLQSVPALDRHCSARGANTSLVYLIPSSARGTHLWRHGDPTDVG